MKSRKNKNEEQGNDTHRWVVSYADFITLLFAFFVVMYAMSSVNVSKYQSLSKGIHSAFNSKNQQQSAVTTDQEGEGTQTRKTKGIFRDGLDELNQSLNEFDRVDYQIKRDEGWIELDIKATSLFEAGNAELKPDAVLRLMYLAWKIKNAEFPIIVEGHSDNVPITSPQYPSNWELSAARAAAVGRLLYSFGVAGDRISVTGYADQYPLMDNTTEWGRSQNRRVSIIIVKNRMIPRIFNPRLTKTDH